MTSNLEPETPAALLTKAHVCELLGGVTAKHVENLVRRGRMPAPIYIDRFPRWSRARLLQWIEAGCPVIDEEKLRIWMTTKRSCEN